MQAIEIWSDGRAMYTGWKGDKQVPEISDDVRVFRTYWKGRIQKEPGGGQALKTRNDGRFFVQIGCGAKGGEGQAGRCWRSRITGAYTHIEMDIIKGM